MFRNPFRTPDGTEAKDYLCDDVFEYAQAFLARERRVLFLRGPVINAPSRMDHFAPSMLGDDIMAMNRQDPKKPIYLVIDSPGGDVPSGLILYDIIRLSKAPVITIGMNCASMATVILAAGAERLCFPHTRMMLHLPSGSITGTETEVTIRSKVLSDIKEELIDCYLECGVTAGLKKKRTPETIRERITKDIEREHWMVAQTAVQYGIVDRIITSKELFGDA